jgi:iron complex transport system substrate-binding protein
MRVATALPAATEIVYALGVEPVAVSHACEYPPAASDRPTLSSCRIGSAGTTEAINQQVADGDPIELDRDVLRETDPDVVVTQAVCDVCALDTLAVADAVTDLDLDCEVVSLDAHTLDEVLASVVTVGDAIGRPNTARDLVASHRERIDDVERRAATATDEDGRPRCLVVDWLDPPMVGGHWVPELVALAGGEYGLTAPGAHSVPRDWQELVAFDPEVLVVAPCGFDAATTRRDLDHLRTRPGWAALTAVESGAVYAMNGDVLNCGSPRLVDALEHLAARLHPDHVDAPPGDGCAAMPLPVPVGGAVDP